MNETVLFGGRVRKTSLPLFHGPPPADASGPKRLSLAQGELANFYDSPEGIRYIAFLELRAGGIRGNHFHRVKVEHVYLFSGRLKVLLKDGPEGEIASLDLVAGDLVRIQPGVAHAFKPMEAGFGVEFSPNLFNGEDIIKVPLE
jgi:mannose-6-phosphate isomerase-like protein (cupin superfamily)